MATFIIRYLRNLFDVNTTGAVPGDVLTLDVDNVTWVPGAGGGGGGAPTTADYLVGTANASLTNEIVVGPTPGGELGGTWASPTVPGAVITAPPSSARNVIVPTVGTAIDLIVKAHAAQSVDLMQWQSSAGAVLASINEVGGLLIDNTDLTRYSLEIRTPGLTSDFGEVMQIVNGSGQQIFYMASNGYTEMKFEPNAGAIAWTAIGGPIGMYMDAFQGFAVTDGGGPATYFWWVNPDGYEAVAANTEPADGDILAGEVFNWYDDTNGAAFFYRKGKTADGTVVKTRASMGTAYTTPYVVGGTDVALADGGTGASLADPNADRIMFWDDSAGAVDWLTAGTGLTITGTQIDASASGAPSTATYITQTADAGLSAEQALSALATGLVKNTTGTGVLSIGAAGTDYYAPGGTDVAVADGGTGASTAAAARTNLGIVSGRDILDDGQAGIISPTAPGWRGSSIAFTANRALGGRFVLLEDMTVVSMRFFVASAGAGNIDMGIYNAAGTRLASTGSTAGQKATGLGKTVALTASVALTAGTVYYAVLVSDSTTGTYLMADFGAAVGLDQFWGTTAGPTVGTFNNSAFPLPDPLALGVPGGGQISPIIGLVP